MFVFFIISGQLDLINPYKNVKINFTSKNENRKGVLFTDKQNRLLDIDQNIEIRLRENSCSLKIKVLKYSLVVTGKPKEKKERRKTLVKTEVKSETQPLDSQHTSPFPFILCTCANLCNRSGNELNAGVSRAAWRRDAEGERRPSGA